MTANEIAKLAVFEGREIRKQLSQQQAIWSFSRNV